MNLHKFMWTPVKDTLQLFLFFLPVPHCECHFLFLHVKMCRPDAIIVEQSLLNALWINSRKWTLSRREDSDCVQMEAQCQCSASIITNLSMATSVQGRAVLHIFYSAHIAARPLRGSLGGFQAHLHTIFFQCCRS